MTRDEFITEIAPLIMEECKKRGYKTPSAIVAQACIESANGNSILAAKYHNYFGMKCGSYWKGKSVNMATKEEYASNTVSIRDNFRVYDDMAAGVEGYFNFISTPRYENLKSANTSKEYLEMIKADGYATSSNYVSTVLSVANSGNIPLFDIAMLQEATPKKKRKKKTP